MKAMAHDVEDRYINATALLRDLEELRNNPDATFVSMPQAPEMERRTDLYVRSAGKSTGREAEVEEPAIVERKEVRWGNSGMGRAEENDFEEETSVRGRISTIAVVACSLVAILAIIIFMILLTQKDSAMTALPADDTVLLQQQAPLVAGTTATETPIQVTTTATRIPAETVATSQMVYTTSTAEFPVLVEMKNLVNLSRQEAEQILASRGFTNIHWVQQESYLPAGTVIGQSVEPNTLADVNAPLCVTCAAGAVTLECSFDLPFSFEHYYLTIMLDGRPVVVEQRMEPFCATATFSLTGSGKQTCELYVNGQLYYSVMVDFDAYAAK